MKSLSRMALSLQLLRGAAAIALPALLVTSAAMPAQAQISVSIGFDNFHSRLAPYGSWSNHPRWGEVWHPTRVGRDFRPYYDGHWVNTREYGWTWVSDESWGEIPYHYGRWVRDPREGWLWVPGYVWGPSWVVWRSGGGNIGWFPMPPGDNYYGDGAYRDNFDSYYGYRDWYGSSFDNSQFLSLWVFVGDSHFGDRNYRNYAVPQRDYGRFIGQTRDSTNYTTVNNYVVNRSINVDRLPQDTRQRFAPVAARSVIRDTALVTPVPAGRQIEQRERQQRPIPATQTVPSAGANPLSPRNAPAANVPQQNGNQPQNTQRRGNGRNPQANDANPAAPPFQRAAPSAAPESAAPRQNDNQPAAQGRGNDRNPGANDRGQAAPQTPRVAPVTPAAPPVSAPRQNDNQPAAQGRGNDRNPGADDRSQAAPQTRAAPEPRVRDAAPAMQAPARRQDNAPAQDNARGNSQPDARGGNDQKDSGDRKGGDRNRN